MSDNCNNYFKYVSNQLIGCNCFENEYDKLSGCFENEYDKLNGCFENEYNNFRPITCYNTDISTKIDPFNVKSVKYLEPEKESYKFKKYAVNDACFWFAAGWNTSGIGFVKNGKILDFVKFPVVNGISCLTMTLQYLGSSIYQIISVSDTSIEFLTLSSGYSINECTSGSIPSYTWLGYYPYYLTCSIFKGIITVGPNGLTSQFDMINVNHNFVETDKIWVFWDKYHTSEFPKEVPFLPNTSYLKYIRDENYFETLQYAISNGNKTSISENTPLSQSNFTQDSYRLFSIHYDKNHNYYYKVVGQSYSILWTTVPLPENIVPTETIINGEETYAILNTNHNYTSKAAQLIKYNEYGVHQYTIDFLPFTNNHWVDRFYMITYEYVSYVCLELTTFWSETKYFVFNKDTGEYLSDLTDELQSSIPNLIYSTEFPLTSMGKYVSINNNISYYPGNLSPDKLSMGLLQFDSNWNFMGVSYIPLDINPRWLLFVNPGETIYIDFKDYPMWNELNNSDDSSNTSELYSETFNSTCDSQTVGCIYSEENYSGGIIFFNYNCTNDIFYYSNDYNDYEHSILHMAIENWTLNLINISYKLYNKDEDGDIWADLSELLYNTH